MENRMDPQQQQPSESSLRKAENRIDPELLRASSEGDIAFLIKRAKDKLAAEDAEVYFLGLQDHYKSNILNMAAFKGNLEFMDAAIRILPTHILLQLFSNPYHRYGYNPFHEAARLNHAHVIRPMIEFYKSYSGSPLVINDVNHPHNKPWLAISSQNTTEMGQRCLQTPLHVAISNSSEKSAMELVSLDMELVCSMVDEDGNSPLFLAVKKGLNRVAETILNSDCSYSLCGQGGSTALHVAPNYSSDNVTKLLLKKHLDYLDTKDNEGFNVLHKWAIEGSFNKLELVLDEEDDCLPADCWSKIFEVLVFNLNDEVSPSSPFYLAMTIPNIKFVKALIEFYQQQKERGGVSFETPPWHIKSNNGDTLLHTAISLKLKHHAMHFLELESTLCEVTNNKGESPLLAAVREGCEQVVEKILNLYPNPCYTMLRRNDGLTLLHLLKFCSEKIAKRLLGKFWWMIHLKDDKGRTAFDEAKEDTPWLVNLLMNTSSIPKEPFDWKTRCNRGEMKAVLDFVHACNDLEEVCRRESDTPLHHIKFQTYKEYVDFLKIPSIRELKNIIDREGATPLHQALKRKDLNLAKALLIDNEVERNIVDHSGNTALGLLAELYKEHDDWAKMCKLIKVNPYLKTTYIQSRTDLREMRGTLSVVAALLATITFAAAFTLPGGLNGSGYGVLAKKAPFLVFLIADAYAMCTSMFVLFCLIWSMVSDRDLSYYLVDRSVFILMQSLYGTLLAFMTGIYAVIAHDSLWAAIVVLVLCSSICMSVNRTFLREIITKLIPATVDKLMPSQRKKDDLSMLEEGNSR